MTFTAKPFAADGATPITLPGLHIIVRPDEIIVKALDTDQPAGQPDYPPFVMVFYKDGVEVPGTGRVAFPTLYRYTQYVWPITPDRVAPGGMPTELMAAGLAPPVGIIDPAFPPPAMAPQVYTGPGSEAGMLPYEPNTGERPDLSPILSEVAGEYLITGDPKNMFAWARGADSMPLHITDANGKMPDLSVHPFATLYAGQTGAPYYPLPPGSPNCPAILNDAHHPETSYFAAVASLLWRHLETLQQTVTWYYIWTAYNSKQVGYPILPVTQIRANGQGRRALILAAKATQYFEQKVGPVPDYLFPSSYLLNLIDLDVKFLTDYYMNDPKNRFAQIASLGCVSVFMDDMLNMSMALAADMFPQKYKTLAEWRFKNLYQRIGGESGWPERYPTPYHLSLGPHMRYFAGEEPGDPNAYQKNGTVVNIANDMFPSMKEVWAFYANDGLTTRVDVDLSAAQIQMLLDDPNGALTFVTWDPLAATYSHSAAALYIHAARQGKVTLPAGAEQAYARNHARLINTMKSSGFRVPYRQSFNVVPQALGAPPPVITPQPPPPPADYPKTVHGLLLRAQEILGLIP